MFQWPEVGQEIGRTKVIMSEGSAPTMAMTEKVLL
jgi:hypothetical protein